MGVFDSGLSILDAGSTSGGDWVATTTNDPGGLQFLDNGTVVDTGSVAANNGDAAIIYKGQPAQNPTVGATNQQPHANTYGAVQVSQGFDNFLAGLGVFAGQATSGLLGNGGAINQQALAQQQAAAKQQQLLIFTAIAVIGILLIKRKG